MLSFTENEAIVTRFMSDDEIWEFLITDTISSLGPKNLRSGTTLPSGVDEKGSRCTTTYLFGC